MRSESAIHVFQSNISSFDDFCGGQTISKFKRHAIIQLRPCTNVLLVTVNTSHIDKTAVYIMYMYDQVKKNCRTSFDDFCGGHTISKFKRHALIQLLPCANVLQLIPATLTKTAVYIMYMYDQVKKIVEQRKYLNECTSYDYVRLSICMKI